MRGVRRNVQQIITASNLAVGACDWRSDDIEPLFFFFLLLYINQVRPSLPARVLQWPKKQLFPGCWWFGWHRTQMRQTHFGFLKFLKLAKDQGDNREDQNSWLDIKEGKLNCLVKKSKVVPA